LNSATLLLEVDSVTLRFDGVKALAGLSFDVGRQQICGLIGPNGSGKTTLFNCISGLYQVSSGAIRFEGQSLAAMPCHRIAGLGIGRTFQNVALFRSMSVRDNILAGAHHLGCSGFLANALRLPSVQDEEFNFACWLDDMLDLLELRDVADCGVATLPFGTQKRVELARALIGAPKLLLLDEPACGLNHAEVDALAALLQRIQVRRSLSILLVEHHMALVMRVSDKVVALEDGRRIAEGTPEQVQRAPEVIRAYLGENVNAAAP
jgi:branched-chain amino acid transport system ATP-binding protein